MLPSQCALHLSFRLYLDEPQNVAVHADRAQTAMPRLQKTSKLRRCAVSTTGLFVVLCMPGHIVALPEEER